VIRIDELEFDDLNVDKLGKHAITPTEVVQLLDHGYTVRRNKKTGSGDRQLIGRTHGGRCLTIVLVETPVAGRWRPITGWECTEPERSLLA
jgi:hypothetical protein